MVERGALHFSELQEVANTCNVDLVVIAQEGSAWFPAGRVFDRASVGLSIVKPERLDALLAGFEALLISDPDAHRGSIWDRGVAGLVLHLALGVQKHVAQWMAVGPSKARIMPVERDSFGIWSRGEPVRAWVSGHSTAIASYELRSGLLGFAFTAESIG